MFYIPTPPSRRARHQKATLYFAILMATASGKSLAEPPPLHLDQVIATAIDSDLDIANYRDQYQSLLASAMSKSSLPPPSVALKLANVPIDSFEFDQEPMSQLQLSYTQKLPPREVLKSTKNVLNRSAVVSEKQEDLARARLRKRFEETWIRGWQSKETIKVTEQHRGHFEQVIASAEANYRAGLRRSSQREVLTLNTALARLDSRQQAAETALLTSREWFREWLDEEELARLSFTLGALSQRPRSLHRGSTNQHPVVSLTHAQQQKSKAAVQLASAKARASKSLSLSYGYRDDTAAGASRSDFISLGVSIELPKLRTQANRARVQAAQSQHAITQRNTELNKRRLKAEYLSALNINEALDRQLLTVTERVLPQTRQYAESARAAYGSGEAPFMEMQRAQVSLMEAELHHIVLRAQQLRNSVALRYLATQSKSNHWAQQ